MNQQIEKICDSLERLSQELQEKVKSETGLLLTMRSEDHPERSHLHSSSHISNPGRPWKLGGGAAVAVGILGIIFSTNSVWPYLVGCAGLGSYFYGNNLEGRKTLPNEDNESQKGRIDMDSISTGLNNLTREVQTKWKENVEEAKTTVQKAVEASSISYEKKSQLLEKTFLTERIHLDRGHLVETLHEGSREKIAEAINTYRFKLTKAIRETAQNQVNIYKNISNEL